MCLPKNKWCCSFDLCGMLLANKEVGGIPGIKKWRMKDPRKNEDLYSSIFVPLPRFFWVPMLYVVSDTEMNKSCSCSKGLYSLSRPEKSAQNSSQMKYEQWERKDHKRHGEGTSCYCWAWLDVPAHRNHDS